MCQLIAVSDLEWKCVLCAAVAIKMWRRRDGIQWCKATVLHVFIITYNLDVLSHTAFWWKNVFLPPGKCQFIRPILINKSVWQGWIFWWETRSRKLAVAGSRQEGQDLHLGYVHVCSCCRPWGSNSRLEVMVGSMNKHRVWGSWCWVCPFVGGNG